MQVEVTEPDVVECVVDHVGIEVAGRTGGDLVGGGPGRAQAGGIVVGGEVADDRGHAQFGGEGADGAFEQGGLAGAR